jgi:hypothetical protein
MIVLYRDQERLDARTAAIIAESIRRQPQRWSVDLIWLRRDDGFQIAVFKPFDDKVMDPRWTDKDAFGVERLVVPPKLAAMMLRAEIKRWLRKFGTGYDPRAHRAAGMPLPLQRAA